MSILINQDTRLLVQGITGKEGSRHTRQCRDFGTKVVAGVTPGKGGSFFDEIPVFNTVKEAVKQTNANTSMIIVPAPFAADAILEAAQAKLDLIICITEGVPVQDILKVKAFLKNTKTRLVGPNCPGAISPASRTKVGIMPDFVCCPGKVGVMSRSGSLTYEAVNRLSQNGIGQSTCLGVGGDPVVGTNFIDCLKLFENDPETEVMVIAGEIGGSAEEQAAEYIKEHITKPVVAYVCGITAPPGKVMGHAGAIISGGKGSAKDKMAAFRAAGVEVAETLSEIVEKVTKVLAPHL